MVATLIVLAVILGLALILLPFLHDLMKDREDLKVPIEQKFNVLISMINQGILGGQGEIVRTGDKRQVNLFTDNQANKILHFYYSTGHLTVILKFKFLHKEMKYEKVFYNMRNPSTYDQKDAANEFLEVAIPKMEAHMQSALGSPSHTGDHASSGVEMPDDPMSIINDQFKDLTKTQRLAFMDFMYVIATSDGTKEDKVVNNPIFLQQMRTLAVNWNECKRQLQEKGEDYIYQQLDGIDRSIALMLMLNSYPLASDTITGPVEARVDKFYDCFKRIGYDEQSVNNDMEKATLLMQYFGL